MQGRPLLDGLYGKRCATFKAHIPTACFVWSTMYQTSTQWPEISKFVQKLWFFFFRQNQVKNYVKEFNGLKAKNLIRKNLAFVWSHSLLSVCNQKQFHYFYKAKMSHNFWTKKLKTPAIVYWPKYVYVFLYSVSRTQSWWYVKFLFYRTMQSVYTRTVSS